MQWVDIFPFKVKFQLRFLHFYYCEPFFSPFFFFFHSVHCHQFLNFLVKLEKYPSNAFRSVSAEQIFKLHIYVFPSLFTWSHFHFQLKLFCRHLRSEDKTSQRTSISCRMFTTLHKCVLPYHMTLSSTHVIQMICFMWRIVCMFICVCI